MSIPPAWWFYLDRRRTPWDPQRLSEMDAALRRWYHPGPLDWLRERAGRALVRFWSGFGRLALPMSPIPMAFVEWLNANIKSYRCEVPVTIELLPAGRLLLDGSELNAPEAASEWRLFRYMVADLPVSAKPDSAEGEREFVFPERGRVVIHYVKAGSSEKFTLRPVPPEDDAEVVTD